MRKLKLVVLLFVAASLRGSVAAAQACLGLPSFAAGAVNVNLAVEFPDSATGYALGIGAGRHNHLFANLGAGQISYDDLDERSTFGFLEFGYQIPLGPAQFCPIAGGALQAGPDDDLLDTKITARAASAGAALGLPLGVRFLTLIPNAAVKYDWVSVKFDEGEFGSTSESSRGGMVDLGLGIVLGNRFSVQPLVHIPFGGDEDEISYGVFASVRLGWPR